VQCATKVKLQGFAIVWQQVLCVKINRRIVILFVRNRESFNDREKEIGTGDKSVFGKRSPFWLKFEYVVFVTLLVT
jgi:hypothetical protein